MTYIDDWHYAEPRVIKGLRWIKYASLVGFVILLVSALIGALLSLDAMWPFALIGAVMWVVFGATYRKNMINEKQYGEGWRLM